MTNNKEKVLEIKILKVNDEYSCWYIEKINKYALGEYISESFKADGKFYIFRFDKRITTKFDYEDTNSFYPEPSLQINYNEERMVPNFIKNESVNDLKTLIELINNKFGIKKRFDLKKDEEFYLINSIGEVEKAKYITLYDEQFINLGNCFKTEKAATKAINSDEWNNFWSKVKTGVFDE